MLGDVSQQRADRVDGRRGPTGPRRGGAWLPAVVIVVALVAVLGGCASGAGTPVPTNRPTAASARIAVRNLGALGPVLVNGAGLTLYVFTKEHGGKIVCTGTCATAWPAAVLPVHTVSAVAGQGVQRSLLGTVRLSDGSREVTYGGYPLHTYAGDSAPGDANGEGVQQTWFTVSTSGRPARPPSAG